MSFLLFPFLGSNFFPAVDSGQITLHVRAPVGTRIEDTTQLIADIETASPPRHSRPRDRRHRRQYRPSRKPDQPDLQQFRHHRRAGRRHLHQPERRIIAPRRTMCAAARSAAARFSRHHLFLPARRHHQPDPEFRRARAASTCRSPASITTRPRPSPMSCCARSAAFPASPMRACSSPTSTPQLNFTVDRGAHRPARPAPKRRHQRAGHRAGRHRTDRAELLAQSQERRVLRHRRPDAGIQAGLAAKRC